MLNLSHRDILFVTLYGSAVYISNQNFKSCKDDLNKKLNYGKFIHVHYIFAVKGRINFLKQEHNDEL